MKPRVRDQSVRLNSLESLRYAVNLVNRMSMESGVGALIGLGTDNYLAPPERSNSVGLEKHNGESAMISTGYTVQFTRRNKDGRVVAKKYLEVKGVKI